MQQTKYLKMGENRFMKTNIESLMFQLICDFALLSVICPAVSICHQTANILHEY